MSEVTDLIKQYRAGEFDFQELVNKLVAFPWKPLPPSFFDCEGLSMDEAAMLTDEAAFDLEEGTVEEVEMAWLDDLLTDEEFEQLEDLLPEERSEPPKNFRIYDRKTAEYDIEGFLGQAPPAFPPLSQRGRVPRKTNKPPSVSGTRKKRRKASRTDAAK